MSAVPETAYLEITVFPWWPRKRQMEADTFRDNLDAVSLDDLFFSIVLFIALYLLAPLIVVLLAWLLLPLEFLLLLLIAVVLVVGRFAGLLPWHITVEDARGQVVRHETTRNVVKAVRTVRRVNDGRGLIVRVSWRRV
jgi:hypothetical protein